jgi:GxxExxY protein
MELLVEMCETVAKTLGKGFSECIYQEALCVLLRNNNISYSREHNISKMFLGVYVGTMRADITLHEKKCVIECKSINDLMESHLPQIITYLEILDYPQGIFVNFNQHPNKPLLQLYTVTKKGNNYSFVNYYSKSIVLLNNKGIKITFDTTNQEIEWVNNNIVYNENSILLKSDIKKVYEELFHNKNSNHFIDIIQDVCSDTFKERQKDSVKYKSCIFNYTYK